MSAQFSGDAKASILIHGSPGSDMRKLNFDAIKIDLHQGQCRVTFMHSGVDICYLCCAMPNFAAGETLNIGSIEGSVPIRVTA